MLLRSRWAIDSKLSVYHEQPPFRIIQHHTIDPQGVPDPAAQGAAAAAQWPRLVLVLGSTVTRYRYTEPCEMGDAGDSQDGGKGKTLKINSLSAAADTLG